MMIELRKTGFRPIVFSITSGSERVELGEHPSATMEEASEHLCLLDRGDSGRDGANERNRLGVDGEIVVERIVEQREEMGDLRVDLQESIE